MKKYLPNEDWKAVAHIYGMMAAYAMVDALKHAGKNPTRASLLKAATHLNEANPFLLPGLPLVDLADELPSARQDVPRALPPRLLERARQAAQDRLDVSRLGPRRTGDAGDQTISLQDTKGTLHMKRATRAALAAAAVGAMLAFAGGALAANTGTVAVWHTPMVLGGSSSTTIHINLPQATDPIAAINIYVPTGYTLNLAEVQGSNIGSVDATAFSHDNNLTLPLTGTVLTDAPSSHVSDSTACAGSARVRRSGSST